MIYVTVGERIKLEMKRQKITQNKLAREAKISQSGLSSIVSGQVSPREDTLRAIADALGCSFIELLGEQQDSSFPFIPIQAHSIPIVGTIACGTPITAEQNIDGYADLPEGVRADFALRCRGESMMPTFNDGDIVLLRQQPDVENGQIAAVIINGEATLKHVYHEQGGLLLVADNPAFAPMHVKPVEGEYSGIQGRAVGYTRMFK